MYYAWMRTKINRLLLEGEDTVAIVYGFVVHYPLYGRQGKSNDKYADLGEVHA
jgi:hypothetical protein